MMKAPEDQKPAILASLKLGGGGGRGVGGGRNFPFILSKIVVKKYSLDFLLLDCCWVIYRLQSLTWLGYSNFP